MIRKNIELKKQERKRKLLVACSICMALACFGYFGYTFYEARVNQAYYEDLASLKEQEPTKEVTPPTVTINYEDEVVVVPEILDDKVKEEKVLKDFHKTLTYLDNSHIKQLCGEIALEVIKNGAYYGYIVPSEKSLIL